MPHVSQRYPTESATGKQARPAATRRRTDCDVLQALKGEIAQHPTECARGLLLDGFPKTLEAAKVLDSFLAHENFVIRQVVSFQVTDQILFNRMHLRAECNDTASRADDVDSSQIFGTIGAVQTQDTMHQQVF